MDFFWAIVSSGERDFKFVVAHVLAEDAIQSLSEQNAILTIMRVRSVRPP